MLLVTFGKELLSLQMGVFGYFEHDAVISILTLVDTALIAVLLLIVDSSGYENFVSKLSIEGQGQLPSDREARHLAALDAGLDWLRGPLAQR